MPRSSTPRLKTFYGYQVKPFLKKFYNYMVVEVKEIPATMTANLIVYLTFLQEYFKYECAKLCVDNLSLNSLTLHNSTDFDYHINYCKNIKGPLKEQSKKQFLYSFRSVVEEMLSMEEFDAVMRRDFIRSLSIVYCEIPTDKVEKWIESL